MKTCPSCSRAYQDDSLSFCLDDGSPLLSASVEPPATQRIPPPPRTDPNAATQLYSGQPSYQPQPFAPQPQYGAWTPPPQPQRSSGKRWFVIIGALVVLGIGTLIGLIILGAVVGSRKPTSSYSSTSPTSITADKLRGSWSGFQNGETTTLWINSSYGNTFSGTKEQGDTAVAFEGTINPTTREVTIRETKVVRGTPYSGGNGWALGTEKGTLSYDGQSMSGTGNDKYNPTTPYQWSYKKQ